MTEPYYQDDSITLHHGDALTIARSLPNESVNCIVTSPPYFNLRDYGIEGQYGNESTVDEYVTVMRELFHELRRVLADDGTLWLNLGDTYHNKELLCIPHLVAFALKGEGWVLRNEIVWHKRDGIPEPVKDRLAKRFEPIFLFSKEKKYWFDLDSVRQKVETERVRYDWNERKAAGEPVRYGLGSAGHGNFKPDPAGKNPGDVWSVCISHYRGAHFAVMPVDIANRCVQAGCKPGGTVLDPFSGSGTTGLAAVTHGRRYVGIDLNREYLDLSLRTRFAQAALFDGGAA